MSRPATLSRTKKAADQNSSFARIELLHFEGCPGCTEILGILENVIVQKGFPAEILPVIPDSDRWSDFPGSPTILVNGEDPLPAERH